MEVVPFALRCIPLRARAAERAGGKAVTEEWRGVISRKPAPAELDDLHVSERLWMPFGWLSVEVRALRRRLVSGNEEKVWQGKQ